MRPFIRLLMVLLVASPAAASEPARDLPLERSTIYPFGGLVGNDGGLWFESTVVPAFRLFDSPRYSLVVIPKIVMRMLRTGSAPIANPSYMPRAVVFRFDRPPGEGEIRYWSFLVSHHSNGQSASLFREDGTLDRENGNFATNFLEVGRHVSGRKGWPPDYSLAAEWHPEPFLYNGLSGRYAPLRLHADLTTHRRESWSWSHGATLYLGEDGGYLESGWKRLGYRSELLVGLPAWSGLAVSVAAFLGQDYYNVEFPRHLSTVRIGISTGH